MAAWRRVTTPSRDTLATEASTYSASFVVASVLPIFPHLSSSYSGSVPKTCPHRKGDGPSGAARIEKLVVLAVARRRVLADALEAAGLVATLERGLVVRGVLGGLALSLGDELGAQVRVDLRLGQAPAGLKAVGNIAQAPRPARRPPS